MKTGSCCSSPIMARLSLHSGVLSLGGPFRAASAHCALQGASAALVTHEALGACTLLMLRDSFF